MCYGLRDMLIQQSLQCRGQNFCQNSVSTAVKGGNYGGTSVWCSVGYLLDCVMFTCDVFFKFVPAFSGKPLVADQWLRGG